LTDPGAAGQLCRMARFRPFERGGLNGILGPSAWGILVAAVTALSGGCTPQGDPAIGPDGFRDDFDRPRLGALWNDTGGGWSIVDGEVRGEDAHNRPLWLRRTLPEDVRVAFDARSASSEGDLKFELFGDGVSRATTDRYTATGYVVIFGGWNNSTNAIARLDEHGDDVVRGKARKVRPGHTYRIVAERRDDTIRVEVDGEELVRMEDPEPLRGRGHTHFAFNDWEAEVFFDNLVITPL